MENVNINLQNMPKIKLYHQEELDIADKDTLGEDDDRELEYELRRREEEERDAILQKKILQDFLID